MTWLESMRRMFHPAPHPALDKGAQLRMVRDAPPVVPSPSPFADLAAAHIRIEQLEEDVSDALADRRIAEQAALEECTAHGLTMGNLRRESAELTRVREQRDAARVAETMCSVSRCPRCQTDVGCLPVGWWCDECTRAYPEDARSFGYRAIADRINGFRYDKGGVFPPPVTIRNLSGLLDGWSTTSGDPATTATIDAADLSMEISGPLHIVPCLAPFGGKCTCVVGAHPADTAKVGDQLKAWDGDLDNEGCEALDGTGFACTRVARHTGQHAATAGDVVCAVWPNESEPADDRRPCAKCTDRVHTLSARDWCDWCESSAVQDGDADDELVEKARVLGDEVGQRIVTSAEARDLPNGTVLLNVKSSGKHVIHAVVRDGHGWWSCEDRLSGPIGGDQRYAVLYVPGTAETREVRPVGQRDEAGQRDRAAAVEGAAITLRAHARDPLGPSHVGPGHVACMCGWGMTAPWHTLTEHAHHVAEQLAAVGALGGMAAHEVQCPSCSTTIRARMADAAAPVLDEAKLSQDIEKVLLDQHRWVHDSCTPETCSEFMAGDVARKLRDLYPALVGATQPGPRRTTGGA